MSRKRKLGYSIPPHWLIQGDNSPFYPKLKSVLEDNFDWLIETQHEDGSWHPNWSWGRYDTDWELAKLEWQGILIIKNMIVLNNFDRIESIQ